MKTDRVLETCIYVDDLPAAREFYVRVFGLQVLAEEEGRHVFFRAGQGMFLVFNPDATENPHPTLPVGAHGARGAGHVCFAIGEDEVDAWRDHLKKLDIEIELEMPWPNGARSLYFRDPAGNSVEVAPPKLWGIET